MNTREALEKFVVVGGPVVGMVNANDFTPILEKGLRSSAEEMAALIAEQQTGALGDTDALIDKCITAGIAAMVEQ
jgi:hypothetical protein